MAPTAPTFKAHPHQTRGGIKVSSSTHKGSPLPRRRRRRRRRGRRRRRCLPRVLIINLLFDFGLDGGHVCSNERPPEYRRPLR